MPSWYVWMWIPSLLSRLPGVGAVPTWVRVAEALGWLSLLLLMVWWSLAERLARRSTVADRAFSDRPPGLREFSIEIVLLRDDKEIGMDRGLAWFEDGLFYFNGAATSFVLSSSDFRRRRLFRLSLEAEASGLVELNHSKVRASMRLLPMHGLNHVRFWFKFRGFLSDPPNRAAQRQWPPFVSYADQRIIAGARRRMPEEVGWEAARTGSATGVIWG